MLKKKKEIKTKKEKKIAKDFFFLFLFFFLTFLFIYLLAVLPMEVSVYLTPLQIIDQHAANFKTPPYP